MSIPPGPASTGALRLTSHAIERYRERHRPELDLPTASAALAALADRASPTNTKTYEGNEVWTALDDGREVQLVVKRDTGSRRVPVIVTVLPYKAAKRPVQATSSVRQQIEVTFRQRRKLLDEIDYIEKHLEPVAGGPHPTARQRRKRLARLATFREELEVIDARLCELRAREEDEIG